MTDTTHSSLAHSEAEEDDDYTATPNALRAATRHLTTAICPTSAAVDPTAATPEPKRIKASVLFCCIESRIVIAEAALRYYVCGCSCDCDFVRLFCVTRDCGR